MSSTVVDPSSLAIADRLSAGLQTTQEDYRKATMECGLTGQRYLQWAMLLLLISNVVFFIVLVIAKSVPDWLQVISYFWTIVVAGGSAFYVLPNLGKLF